MTIVQIDKIDKRLTFISLSFASITLLMIVRIAVFVVVISKRQTLVFDQNHFFVFHHLHIDINVYFCVGPRQF